VRWKQWALTVAAIAVIFFVRVPSLYLRPILWAEDGLLFQQYYADRSLAGLGHVYAGYASVGANALGWLAMAFPVTAAPYLLALFGLVTAALAFSCVLACDALLPSRPVRIGVALLVAALPLGTFAESGMAIDIAWSLLIAAALLSISTRPDAPPGRVVTAALLRVIAILTQPVAVILLVFDLWGAIRRRAGLRFLHLGVLAGGVLFKLLAVAPANPPAAGAAARTFFVGLFERGVAEAFVGSSVRWWLREHLPGAGVALGVILVAGLIWLARRARLDAEQRRQLGWLALVAALSWAAAVAGRGGTWDLLMRAAQRYVYPTKVLVVLAAAVLVSAAVPVRRLLVVAAVLGVIAINLVNYGDFWDSALAAEGEPVRAFTHELAALERAHGGRHGFTLVLHRATNRPGMFELTVDARVPSPRPPGS
jgi:hypothetical protein